MELSKN